MLCAATITPLAIRCARRYNLLDQPNHRSSHSRPTPRGGGVAIVAAFYATILGLWAYGLLEVGVLYVLLCGIPIAVVGYWDDLRSLGIVPRLAVQCISATATLAFLWPLPDLSLATWVAPAWMAAIVYGLGLVWLTNLFNFMDGIDGMAAGQMVAISALWAIFLPVPAAQFAVTLMGAALGFLFYNWPPARVFMGDVGSYFCGFISGVLVLLFAKETGSQVAPWLIPLAALASDATVTLLVRLSHGKAAGIPHRSHVYQRLARVLGHLPVTVGYIGVTTLVGGLALAWASQWSQHSWLALTAYATVLITVAGTLKAGRED